MPTHRKLAAAAAILAGAACFAPAARAEVAADTDGFGRYIRTVVVSRATVRQTKIWGVVRRGTWSRHVLNPGGDRMGDQYPAVAENPVDRRRPWVVWSRFRDGEYGLVWSMWRPGGWAPIRSMPGTGELGDDLAPSLAFDAAGRPYLAWWRNEDGEGRVYVSIYLRTRWSEPIAVSELGVDSRTPRVSVLDRGSIQVDFSIAGGTETRYVSFGDTTTITDDLNPVGQVNVSRISEH